MQSRLVKCIRLVLADCIALRSARSLWRNGICVCRSTMLPRPSLSVNPRHTLIALENEGFEVVCSQFIGYVSGGGTDAHAQWCYLAITKLLPADSVVPQKRPQPRVALILVRRSGRHALHARDPENRHEIAYKDYIARKHAAECKRRDWVPSTSRHHHKTRAAKESMSIRCSVSS